MTDVQLFGMNPRGHHFTNVVIHAAAALLLFLLLLRLTGALWPGLFVAALFALHPLHVESVAWVAERKDVLSALFWFLTLLLYAEYAAGRKPALYFLALLSFVSGLMSKPMLVTLPMVMLVLDFWPLGRFQCDRQESGFRQSLLKLLPLLKEKIPFLLCSLLSATITIYAQARGGALANISALPFGLRCENALIASVRYIGATFWPHNLAVYYPFPATIPFWQVISSLLVLLLVSAATIRLWKNRPYLATGWFWFLITLAPVIGLVQVGAQSMADRYTYLPLTGLFIMVAWGVRDATRGMRYRRSILALAACAILMTSIFLTKQQLGYWQDSATLLRHTLDVTSDNAMANYYLGIALHAEGKPAVAIPYYREALLINPAHANAHNMLGIALQACGDGDAALHEFRAALRINSGNTVTHNNLGRALQAKGDLDAALGEFEEALRINPRDPQAHVNRGVVCESRGMFDEAIREYQAALRERPDSREVRERLERLAPGRSMGSEAGQ
jgi:tetratricopeptide (TPR) repeat protein